MNCSESGHFYKGYDRRNEVNLVKSNSVTSKKNNYIVDSNTKRYINECLPVEYREIMTKIIRHESGMNPFAIHVNNAKISRQPSSKEEAIITAKYLIAKGFSVDLGYAQINSQHFKSGGFLRSIGVEIDEIFDPCTNLRAGAKVFGDAYVKHGNVAAALSVYNTGSPTAGIKNGYVAKVLGGRS